jgi:hypothetical protein
VLAVTCIPVSSGIQLEAATIAPRFPKSASARTCILVPDMLTLDCDVEAWLQSVLSGIDDLS